MSDRATPIEIDGAFGEGGGQILRTSLALSLLTGRPFVIERIRAGRRRPGLRHQHLTCVRAAATVGAATVTGDEVGSLSLRFTPQTIAPGTHHFSVGTAGSANLVLQTVLMPLALAGAPSRVTIEGGTHNEMSPPHDFIEGCFLPVINQMGPQVDLELHRRGFAPAGGGKVTAHITPATCLAPIELLDAEPVTDRRAVVILSKLPLHVAQRELTVVRHHLGFGESSCEVIEDRTSPGPGNVVLLQVDRGARREIVTAFGRRGRPAEEVAMEAVTELRAFLDADVPVATHLADQLMIPLALAGGGAFSTMSLSLHSQTNMEVIKRFLDVDFDVQEQAGRVTVRVRGQALRGPVG